MEAGCVCRKVRDSSGWRDDGLKGKWTKDNNMNLRNSHEETHDWGRKMAQGITCLLCKYELGFAVLPQMPAGTWAPGVPEASRLGKRVRIGNLWIH